MPVRTPLPAAANPGAGIDYKLFLDCIHCGLCLSSCPTYEELGTEMDGPRGRIYLMRAVTDGRLALDADVRRHLDLCLDCRACESACPSGVQYHKLVEPFRIALERAQPAAPLPWIHRFALTHIFPYASRSRMALAPARILQRLGVDRWFQKFLPRRLRQMHDQLPRLAPHPGRLPEVLPAQGPRRVRVALFTGCVADAVYPQTNWNSARVLQKNGCEVVVPRSQGCCGALAYHAADEKTAIQFASANCAAFDLSSLDAIITNAAGCGAHLKEYGHLAGEEGAKLAAKVRDISEFLVELGPLPPTLPLNLTATYHDACHLAHAQRVRQPPRQLLEMIPDLKLVPLPESELCCGAAGSYNLSEPEMSERLGRRKAEHILATGASAVFTGNVGCLMQVTRYIRESRPDFWIAHPIDALAKSYFG
jgi:glycolate oxidase iron-sulfur subunit